MFCEPRRLRRRQSLSECAWWFRLPSLLHCEHAEIDWLFFGYFLVSLFFFRFLFCLIVSFLCHLVCVCSCFFSVTMFPFNISTVGGERLSIGFNKGTISLSHLQFFFGQALDGLNYKQFAPFFLSYSEVHSLCLCFPA
jgi:hypothetical protein